MGLRKLFLLDAYALIYRAYYALIKAPRYTSDGLNTSAIYGFVNTLYELLRREKPSHIAVCFDPAGPTFRHEAYQAYKAEREETPEDIKTSIPYIKEIIKGFNIPVIEVPGFEADDVIASLAVMAERRGFEVFMMTPDKDFGQLVTEHVKIYRPAYRGGEFEVRGVEEICERYKLDYPEQVIDLLALMGDKVDNIPGCPGVGEVSAIKLLHMFGTVENMFTKMDQIPGALQQKVRNNVEQIKFSKFLATIRTDAPVDFDEEAMRYSSPNPEVLKPIFERLEFRMLMSKVLDIKYEKQPAVKPLPERPPQLSLFDMPAEEESQAESAPTPEVVEEHASVEMEYELLTDEDTVRKAVAEFALMSEVGYAIVSEGEDAMTSQIRGIAMASSAGKGVYVPVSESNVALLAPLFESKNVMKVGSDVKFDKVLLRRYGINLSQPYYDTEVAHYLIQPEQSHGYYFLSETYLKYTPMSSVDLYVKKGKGYVLNEGVTDMHLCYNVCEKAGLLLKLRPILNTHIVTLGMEHLLNDIELPLIEVLADMEYTGVRLDVTHLNNYSAVLTAKMNEIENECYTLAGEHFNVASPMQVGEILFEKLKIDPKAKRTRKGQFSTTEEILSKLVDRHPLVPKILELRGVKKLLSTYVNALPELINSHTGRIHTTFNQTVTATGRLSSTNPNLQNIPVRDESGREIRRAFIPSEGNLFFSADYSQIELRLVANMSGDEAMIDAFSSDVDIHKATAAKIFHTTPAEVTDHQRRVAKTANFGILYGISAFGLSERLQISRTESKQLIEGYMQSFPELKNYIDKSVALGKEQGYVTTAFGRRRMLPDINSLNSIVRGFSERNAVNAPVQGTAADVIKIAMVRIFDRFRKEGLKSKMTLQVHDELNFDVYPDEVDKVTRIVVETMRGAYEGRVPLEVSYNVGKNWLEAH